MNSPTETTVVWMETPDVHFPYKARVDGRDWLLRLGDFPEEPLYTLFIDGQDRGPVESWPTAWARPRG